MNWLGDYPEDFTTVAIYFTTHDGNGAPVAPLTAFEADDVKIYKDGSGAQKTSTNGLTMTSPFDSIVGLHCLLVDTSNDTGDAAFWVVGHVYTVVLNPDTETVNGQTALKVIGTFGICLAPALRPTTAGRTLDVTATGAGGIDWGNVENLTTSNGLSGTTIATTQVVASVSGAVGSVTGLTASDVGNIKTKTDFLPSVTAGASGGVFIAGTNAATTVTTSFTTTFTGNLTGSVGSVTGLTAADVGSIKTKTDFLPSATAGAAGGVFIAGTNAATTITTGLTATFTGNLTGNVGGNVVGSVGSVTGLTASNLDATVSSRSTQLSVDDIPTNAELATALGTADDAVLAQVALVKAKTDSLTFTQAGQVDANIQYVNDVAVNGTGALGDEWGP